MVRTPPAGGFWALLGERERGLLMAAGHERRVAPGRRLYDEGQRAPSPPPDSWAARPDAGVAIWTIRMQSGSSFELPAAPDPLCVRTLYFFGGRELRVDTERVSVGRALVLRSDRPLRLEAVGDLDALLLQGRPISEPVAHYGPFVMNTQTEIREAIADYQRTQFGGWPWTSDGPVHPRTDGRFARHADGRFERA